MEIVHLILGKANPERMNGVNKVVHQLATKQTENGQNVSVWGITKDLEENFGTRNFKTRLFKKSRNPFAIPTLLKKAIEASATDTVFHLHGGWIPVFFSLSLFLKKNNRKMVITAHGSYNQIAMNKNKTLKKWYYRFFEKKVLFSAETIHCIGQSEEEGLQNFHSTKKSVLVPYGFEMQPAENLNITQNQEIIFGFIGRLDIFTKGLDTLLEAFAKTTKEIPKAQLWIVGEGNQKNTLVELISELALEKNVFLLGGKFGKEKEEILQKIDVFVHPSRNEGLPASVLEAASFGKPCIITDATNLGNEIRKYNCGMSISSQNSRELAQTMWKMHQIWKNQPEFLIIRKNAIKMVFEAFNWKKVLSELNRYVYQSA